MRDLIWIYFDFGRSGHLIGRYQDGFDRLHCHLFKLRRIRSKRHLAFTRVHLRRGELFVSGGCVVFSTGAAESN